MTLEYFLAKRYLLGKKKESLMHFMSIMSIIGISIGVAALIIVLSVMSGFDEKIKEKIIGEDFHIFVKDTSYDTLKNIKNTLESLDKEVDLVSFYADSQVFIKVGGLIYPVFVRGVEQNFFTKFSKFLRKGNIDIKGNQILIGKTLAEELSLNCSQSTEGFNIWGKEFVFKIGGIFDTGFYNVDRGMIFTSLDLIKKIDSYITPSLGIKLKDVEQVDEVSSYIKEHFPEVQINTWIQRNKTLFSALKLEKITMFLILSIIILVATFNVVSVLMIKVVQKTKDIGILKSLGLNSASIAKIFIWEALLLGIVGVGVGLIVGISLCFIIDKYHIIRLPQDIYYLEYMPVNIKFIDLVCILVCSLSLCFLAGILPALRAKKVDPSSCLRYE